MIVACVPLWQSWWGFFCVLLVTLWRKFTNDLFSTYSSSASPESGLGTSHTSLPGSGGGNDPAAAEEMYYEAEPLQPLGTCKALYTFEGECVAGVEECPRACAHPLLPSFQPRARGAFR